MLLYANADKSKLVPEGDPEARYVVNTESPGEFAGLLKAKQEADETEAAEKSAKAAEAPKAATK